MAIRSKILASFRDPSGFVFKKDSQVYRQINKIYQKDYDLLINSGLFAKLVKDELIVDHTEVKNIAGTKDFYKIIKPQQLNFISYPYEWCFDQLKDAALLTLKIQKLSLAHDLSLKDASAYNIQFKDGKPILIDTLSFEAYTEGKPWIAYRQFCQHFLAPLALMAHTDLRFGLLSQIYLDGIPLDLAAKLLPTKTKFSLGLSVHLHLHARSQIKNADKPANEKRTGLSKNQLIAILENLTKTVESLNPPKQKTVWGEYYDDTNYSQKAFLQKKKIISAWIKNLKPKTVWDAGANDATFSRLAAEQKIFTIASDIDPVAIEHAYVKAKKSKESFLLPLIVDLTNPSPAIGWENEERNSFLSRANFDLSMCLAFIHHLAIFNNLPFSYIAKLFSEHSQYLIIEFVPKEDSNTKRLLANREDIFPDYNEKSFEKEFSNYFKIAEKISVKESTRTLYLMKKI